jgi:hypothetical protein
MVSAAQIAELLAERRFDPTIAPQLESYVNEQVKGGTHDLEANLALLRFYQYNPSTTQVPIVAKVCLPLQSATANLFFLSQCKFGCDWFIADFDEGTHGASRHRLYVVYLLDSC